MKRPRVFLADDHCIILQAFRNLLEPDYEVVGTATDGREMLAKVSKLNPDVVVLDIGMPNLNGLDAARKLRKQLPDVKIVFLTMNEDPDMVTEAFRIGANGYLLKNSDATELYQAIDVVLSGGSYITPQITQGMISSFIKNPNAENTHRPLTLRQREVLQLLAEGKTMKEVAAVLFITPRTVAFHKYKMMDDLDLKSNSELIQYALKHSVVC
jgi:DNA-binding NarL/FixJ family response regulator